jgi:uncharacterized membrane protein
MDTGYLVKLVAASAIAAHALVVDSVEGVVASMLVSPVIKPILVAVAAMAAGDSAAVVTGATTTALSALVCVVTGAIVRAFVGGEVTTEIRKRTAPFDRWFAFLYACAIGALMVFVGACDAVMSVGLAIAVSILPPLVAAGISLTDRDLSGARSAAALAVYNILGVACGAAAVHQVV